MGRGAPAEEAPSRPGGRIARALHRELSIVKGWPEARATIAEWRAHRFRVLLPWLGVSVLIALLLLGLVWLVGATSPADPTRPPRLPGDPFRDPAGHALHLVRNNLIVLALHAAACLAGYIVHVAMTEPSDGGSARLERLTRGTAGVAVLFVPVATLLSIATQAWVLGSYLSTAAGHLQVGVGRLLATTLPHAVVELTAVFLPLAASIVMLARRQASMLLAATLVSVAVAIPMLVVAAWSETYTWPQRVGALRAANPPVEGRFIGALVLDPVDHFSAELQLRIGEAVQPDVVHETPEEAARAAAGPSTAGPAIAIVSTPRGYALHQVVAHYSPGFCERGRRSFQDRPFELSMVGEARFLPEEPPGARTQQPVFVLGFVDGPVQRSYAELVDVERERTFRRCVDDAAG